MKYKIFYYNSDKIILTEITPKVNLVQLYIIINTARLAFPEIKDYNYIIYKKNIIVKSNIFNKILKFINI